jgi:hypothetical protein
VGLVQAADLGGSVESVLLGPLEARSALGGSSIFGAARGLARTGSFRRSANFRGSISLRDRVGNGGSSGGGGEDVVLRQRGAELRAVCDRVSPLIVY